MQSPPQVEAKYYDLAPGSHAPELGGNPVASPQTKSTRHSELYGSEKYGQSPTSPAVSPPQYSPGNRRSMAQVAEEPQEMWGGYMPYRPPQADLPAEDDALASNEARVRGNTGHGS